MVAFIKIICYFPIGGLKMENIENVNEADKKKPLRKREEGGGDQTPHEMKQNYS